MKKQEFKTIVAIETTINSRTEYISGQSTRDYDNKYVPQFNQDPVHAFEFDNEQHAAEYIANIHNPFHRMYNVIAIEIPVIKYLKKYDRDKKKQSLRLATPVLRDALIIFIACIVLVSCSNYNYSYKPKKEKCPSENQQKLNKHADRPFKA